MGKWKEREFILALVAAVLPIANKTFALGIPEESTYALLAYVLGRCGVKAAKEFKSDAKTKSTG